MIDLQDMLAAREERELELQRDTRRQLDTVFSRLASIIGGADRALACPEEGANGGRDALLTVRNQLLRLLEDHDIELIGKSDDPIDPTLHVVVETRVRPDSRIPRIDEVLSYGARTTHDGRILAQAQVVATLPSNKLEG